MRKQKNKNRLTRSEALAFKKRWEVANAFEKEELGILSKDEKLGKLAMLMTSAKEFDWTKALEAEANEVRDRWNELRKAYHA
jgi:hypothetical protein